MKDLPDEIVRHAVAQHLGVDIAAVQYAHRLQHDLALLPLDVVLIALRLEEVEKIELPIDRLEPIETVADLVALVKLTLAAARRENERFIARVRHGHARRARLLPYRWPHGG